MNFGLIITGLISLIIGIFNYKVNYIGLILGYILISIAIISVLLFILINNISNNTPLKFMNAVPFIIMLISIIRIKLMDYILQCNIMIKIQVQY